MPTNPSKAAPTLADYTAYFEAIPPALSTRPGPDRASTKQVVARIREDLASAVGVVLPAGTETSITVSRGTNADSIRVKVIAWSGAVFSAEHEEILLDGGLGTGIGSVRYSDDLAEALRTIRTITDRHNYRHYASGMDFAEVGYFVDVDANHVEAIALTGIRCEIDPAHADFVERARAAGARLGSKVVTSICGSYGIGGAADWCLAKLIQLDESAAGRPVAYDKRARRWRPQTVASHDLAA